MGATDEEYLSPNRDTNTPSSKAASAEPDSKVDKDEGGVSKRTRSTAPPRGPVSDLKGQNGYAWEDEYQRSWDIVKDDEHGGRSLENIIKTMIENRKKKIMKNPSTPFQRGIIRSLIVIIDGSSAMSEKDLRPTRFSMTLSYLQEFVVEFFDQNPISQLGIILMRNGVSNLVSEVNGSPQYHLDKIRQLKARQHNRYEPKGDPSLQNSLEMARSLLKYNFGNNANDTKNSKEVLIIFGALFTSDPGDIHKTIDNLVKDEIKVKIIGLSAQVAICQELVNRTNHQQKNLGSKNYGVIMNESHFKELWMDCVIPLPITTTESQETKASKGVPLIKMGFPTKIQPVLTSSLSSNDYIIEFPQLSASDPTQGLEDAKQAIEITNNNNGGGGLHSNNVIGYQCPQCKSKVVNLPTLCPVCGLMLILSTHLARSYHHLVPLVPFKEVPVSSKYDSKYCFGCLLKFPRGVKNDGKNRNALETMTSSRYRCYKCSHDFCIDCDVFIHEVLHNCPGCENN
ncbi:component of RNA polymerase transcription factor [Scheffersomyces xylosifermentans]|uniref:component of RNA polymerase transcription factor n=1 Tax=Scheffersomyces xylosifermentans TaxID=1304137 RepID=UPI00315D77C3